MKTLRAIGFFCFVLYGFHILRNLTQFYYFVLGLSLILFFALSYVHACYGRPVLNKIAIIVLFFWIYGTAVSLFYCELDTVAVGIFRFWAAFPLVLIGTKISRYSLKLPMFFLVFLFIVATLSFPIQYVSGPIEWFASSSERAGAVRYASSIGSLTSYGIFLGVPALAVLFFFRGFLSLLLFSFFLIGALLSLQKAAIANVFLAFIFAWRIRVVPKKAMSIWVCLALCLVFFLTALIDFGNKQFLAPVKYLQGLVTSDTVLTSDVSFIDSLLARVVTLPLESASFHGVESLVAGVGVLGGGGALGFDRIPMPHNGLMELILIFGFPFGGFLIFLLASGFLLAVIQMFSVRCFFKSESLFLSASYIIWFVNFLFSGGGLFHPVGASIFWIIVFRSFFIVCNRRRWSHCVTFFR
jgi:hypothetical protein